ncbi:hypothetical protein ACEXQB_005475 [Herbiconiux sp. P18]|uniref:hypothetical protein n=1 Tax=Herbiconiux liangxiaofengii TaxID=3342795 RepID=UPI0035B97C32
MTGGHYLLVGPVRHDDEWGPLRRIQARTEIGRHEVSPGDIGGWITIDGSAQLSGRGWVADDAVLCGSARVTHEAVLEDSAVASDDASLSGRAVVGGTSRVGGRARVAGHASVGDRARVLGSATLRGYSSVQGDAHCAGGIELGGDVVLTGFTHLIGDAVITDHGQMLVIGPYGRQGISVSFFRSRRGELLASCSLAHGAALTVLAELQAPADEYAEPVISAHRAEVLRQLIRAEFRLDRYSGGTVRHLST